MFVQDMSVQFCDVLPFFFFLAASGLRCCARAFSSSVERGLLFVAVHGLLIVVASLVVQHRLQARGLQQLWHVCSAVVDHRLQSTGSVVVAHGLSCSAACGIFPDQGSNPCPLHWQVRHQGRPRFITCVDLSYCYPHPDTELFHCHKRFLICATPLQSHPSYSHPHSPPSLTPGSHYAVLYLYSPSLLLSQMGQ